MELSESNIMFKIVDRLLNYGHHFLGRNDYGLTPEEFNTFRHDSAACFIPLIKWSKPLVSYQKVHDACTNQTIWTSTQTMRYAVGASLISLGYKKYLDFESLQNSIIAKAFDKYQVGILDDIIDRGNYDYQEAKDLYRHVISSMTTHDFDYMAFQEELNGLLNPSQLGISDIICSMASAFSTFFFEAPRAYEVLPIIKELDERIIEGQALTVLQKESYLDMGRLRSATERFYAPEAELRWYEKLANHISGGIRYNIIDIAYTNDEFDMKNVDNILKAWYFYDIIMVFLNNIVDLESDLKNGIYNLSLIDMKNGDISSVDRNNPQLTLDDYERHILRNAELARKAFKYVNGDEENRKFYLYITMMIPLIMMADWVGSRDEIIELFLTQVSEIQKT